MTLRYLKADPPEPRDEFVWLEPIGDDPSECGFWLRRDLVAEPRMRVFWISA